MAEGGQRLESGTWYQREALSISLHPIWPPSLLRRSWAPAWGATNSEGVGPLGL